MKKIFVAVFLAALVSLAFAQTPRQVATAVFDRVYAQENAITCAEAAHILNEDLSEFDFVYCAVIGDTLTDINQRWTTGIYQDFGYRQEFPWQRMTFGRSYYPVYGSATLYSSRTMASVASLGIVSSGGMSGTIIVLVFNRL